MSNKSGAEAALIAFNRFGLGARRVAGGDVAAVAADPRGFLLAELGRLEVGLITQPGLASSTDLLQALFIDEERIKAERARAASAAPAPPARANGNAMASGEPAMAMDPAGATAAGGGPAKPAPKPPTLEQATYRAEAQARFRQGFEAPAGLVERLVAFWSNHFAVSVAKAQFIRMTAGSFEREAIRPHVLGRFADMLAAVERHPTMLHYLDNQDSIGPGSKVGLKNHHGLNENLAREILELHTLGVGGGYSQGDVTSFARIITGWSSAGRAATEAAPGAFLFRAPAHEPGAQTLLGKSYSATGVAQGEAALADLARHPATARFIAGKLARHFVADAPPPALVASLEATFRDSDGDLGALARALVNADAAWSAPPTKMRSPYEFLIAAARLAGALPDDPALALGALAQLGQPLWTPPGPNGFADTSAVWASPEGLKLRLDLAAQLARQVKDIGDPAGWLDALAGSAASAETREAVARAASRPQALALILMSPEMQRR